MMLARGAKHNPGGYVEHVSALTLKRQDLAGGIGTPQ